MHKNPPPFGPPNQNDSNKVQASAGSGGIDELTRVFNSALISTQSEPGRDFSAELLEVVQSAPFRAILHAVRQHAALEGLTERVAAEQVISAFRKVDRVWSDYVQQEGIDRVRGLGGN